MPHASVRTIRDLIYWEYAKLISGSSVGDRRNYRFTMFAFQRLRSGKIHPSAILRENKMITVAENSCVYCGAKENLSWDHIIPKEKIIIDTIDNQVLACEHCNCSKGCHDPFEWYGLDRRYELPRVVLGKYLKIIFEIHEKQGTLDVGDLNEDGRLDVYDLGVILR